MTRRYRLHAEELDRRDVPAIFGVAWPSSNLTLSFAPDGTDVNGSASRLTTTLSDAGRVEVLRAFQTWASAANVNVGLMADGGQPIGAAGGPVRDTRFGDIRLAAAPLDGVVALALPFDRIAGTRSGDVFFNSSLPFGIGSGTFYDTFTTTLHEAGHVFGVPGSTDPNSVMADSPLTPRTALAPADVAGIVALYGTRAADAYEGQAGNETTATAPEIEPQGGSGPSTDAIRVTADLTTATDVDTFRFRPNDLDDLGLTASVTVAGYSLLVPRLEILDAAGKVIASGVGDSAGAGDVTIHLPTLTEGATYFARVTATNSAFAIGGYKLALVPDATGSGDDDDDEIDPESGGNDSAATATTLEQLFEDTDPRLDYSLNASLGTTTDVDVYRLKSPHEDGTSAGVLTVFAWAKTAGLDPVIEVTDHDGIVLPGVVLDRDGGAFTLQIPDTAANDDFFVRVHHAHPGAGATPGNYALAVDFGGKASDLPELASGTATASAPIESRDLTVSPSGVLHLTLTVAGTAPAAGVRLSILNAAGTVVDSRFAPAGETVSLTRYLPAGTYRLLTAGGTTNGSATPALPYRVRGAFVSDPIGPRAVDLTPGPTSPPPAVVPPTVPPNLTVTPPTPLTPVTPVDPTSPNWIVLPPTDWPAPPGTSLKPAPKPLPRTVSTGAGSGGSVRSFAADGNERFAVAPFAGFTGGVRVAEADFNGDGVADLLAGTGPGGPTHIRILDGVTRAELFAVDPFEASFTGGVYVAAGDVTGDGKPDVVVTPDEGGGPRVDVYSGAGFGKMASFFGIDDPNFRGGARAAVGDISGDGRADLIVVAGFGGGPRVAGFDGTSIGSTPTHLFGDFFAFEQTLRNGVFVAAGDLDGDGYADLVAGGGPGGGPRVTAFSGKSLLSNVQDVRANFFGGDVTSRGGVRVAVKDFDADGRADVVVGAGANAGNRVTAYRGADIGPSGTPPEMMAFDAFAGSAAGVFVG